MYVYVCLMCTFKLYTHLLCIYGYIHTYRYVDIYSIMRVPCARCNVRNDPFQILFRTCIFVCMCECKYTHV